MELFNASSQWANRPADERYWSIADMLADAKGYAKTARTVEVASESLRLIEVGGDLRFAAPDGSTAALTNWSFKQVCARGDAHAACVSKLPADLAAEVVNYGLAKSNGAVELLVHQSNGPDSLVVRAATSDKYERIWNFEVLSRLAELPDSWVPPLAFARHADDPRNRPATAEDIARVGGRTVVTVGTTIGPAGLYASDHDMFAFLVNPDREVDDGTELGLARGVIVKNSEVGDGALWMMGFLYRFVCGNHIIWDAKDVRTLRVVHRTGAHGRIEGFEVEAKKMLDASVADDEKRIVAAKKLLLGATKEEVLDLVFGKKGWLSKRAAERAYELAEENPVDGDPKSAWGFAAGVTRLAQDDGGFADSRVALDRTASKVLALAS